MNQLNSFFICGFNFFFESSIIIASVWKKFKDTHLGNNKYIIIYSSSKGQVYNGLRYSKLSTVNSNLVICDNDIMVVNEDWSKANIIKMEHPESLDAFTMQLFYTHAVRNHMIQVHSSLIEYKNSGIMFLGPSGIGKTTQAELWHQYLDALIINGDCVFVEDKGDEFIGWGTPWHGSSPYCENTSVSVKALIVLKQGQENRIRKLEGFEKVSEVSNNIIYPMWIEDGMDLCLETLDHLLTHVPVYELVNKADEDSVLMVKQVVFDEKN